MQAFWDLTHNISFWCALTAWTLAQAAKFARHYWKTNHIDFSYFVRTGGMPSSHSSLVCALALSIGLRSGFGSAVFAVTLVFASVVMFDAQSVRRAAGHQARLLNQMVEELFKEHHLSQQKLVEFLGHTRTEVFAGMAMGVAVTLVIHGLFG
jgi:acid phosphatase family membrane protein YuiD